MKAILVALVVLVAGGGQAFAGPILLPDLVPLTINASTPAVTVGGNVSFFSIVQNAFDPVELTSPDAINASATLYLGTPGNSLFTIGKTIPGVTIAGGLAQFFNISWNIPSNFVPGTYGFYVNVDADNEVSERNESNNILLSSFSLTLLPQNPGPTPVTEPATVLLFTSGMAALAAARIRRKKGNSSGVGGGERRQR